MSGRERRAILTLLLSFGFSFFPIPARAETLTLSECIRRARRMAPDAVAALAASQRAESAYKEAFGKRLPHFYATGLLDQSNNESIQLLLVNQAMLGVRQNLSPFTPQWALAKVLKKLAGAALLDKEGASLDVALAVKNLYFAILLDRDTLANFDRVRPRLGNVKDAAIPKYNIGRVPPFDLVKMDAAIYDLDRSKDLMRADLAGQSEALALLVGLSSGAGLKIAPLGAMPPAPSSASFANNPTVAALTLKIKAAKSAVTAQVYERLPTLDANILYGYEGYTFNLPFHYAYTASQAQPAYAAGYDGSLTMNLPLFYGGEITARIAQRRAGLDAAKASLEKEIQRLSAVWARTVKLARTHERDHRRRQVFLTDAKIAADSSVERYRRGAAGILEVAEALNLWLGNLVTERVDYYSYLADIAQLERASGRDIVDYEKK